VYIQKNINLLKQAIGRLLYIIPERPAVAQIEITNICNLDCAMCQRKDLGVSEKHIKWKIFLKILDKLKDVKKLILCGWGEPLCHPDSIRMIEYAKSKGFKVSITTNGTLLDSNMADKLIATGIDSISISIDDVIKEDTKGHVIGNQLDNIDQLIKKVKNKGAETCIILQTTYHKNGEDKIARVIEFAGKVGADKVNINRLDIRFNPDLERPDYEEEKKLVRQMTKISDRNNTIFEFKIHTFSKGIVRWISQKIIPLTHKKGKHCLRVYDYLFITQEGDVSPCCSLPKISFGNIFTEDINKIWFNENFRRFRETKNQRKICGKCDVLELKQVGKI